MKTVLNGKNRRKGMSLLYYYLAGGSEHRQKKDRRDPDARLVDSENRSYDRRRIVDPKFFNYGKVIDCRKSVRRAADRIDPAEIERYRIRRLGPGWM